MMCLAAKVPAILELADAILVTRASADQIVSLKVELDHSLSEHITWVSESIASGDLCAPRSIRIDSSQDILGLSSVSLDTRAFDSFLRFKSMEQALCYMLYWICMLQLQEVRLDLALLTWPIDNTSILNARQMIDQYASSLCRSLGYFYNAADGLVCRAILSRAPIHFARRGFCKIGKLEKVLWCDLMEFNVRQSVPFLQWDVLLSFGLFILPWIL
jgi:hypothetical protein